MFKAKKGFSQNSNTGKTEFEKEFFKVKIQIFFG